MIKAVIIDDESYFVDVLKTLLNRNELIEIVASASSVKEGVNCIQQHQPDLVFLDIEMPEQNGFALIEQFDNPSFKVVFTTAYDEHAIKAIKYSALDYLLKPIDRMELNDTVKKVSEQLYLEDHRIQNFTRQFLTQNGLDKIMISGSEGFRSLCINDIVSIESKPGNYSIFSLRDGKEFICTKALKHYADLLPPDSFYRAHRSYIINLNYFSKYEHQTGEITLNDAKVFEVATRRRAELTELLRSKFKS